MKIKHVLALLGVIAACLTVAVAVWDMPSPADSKPGAADAPVTVTLLGPLQGITGVTVPAEVSAGRRKFFQITDPSVIQLTLAEGRMVSLPVKTAFVNTEAGVVVDVDLLPLMKSVAYKDAVAELHRILAVLKIEPDARMKGKMREWPEDAPGFDPINRAGFYPHKYRAETAICADVAFLVELRAAADGGWFLVLTFAVDGPKRRALWDRTSTRPSPQLPTRPVTRPSDGR